MLSPPQISEEYIQYCLDTYSLNELRLMARQEGINIKDTLKFHLSGLWWKESVKEAVRRTSPLPCVKAFCKDVEREYKNKPYYNEMVAEFKKGNMIGIEKDANGVERLVTFKGVKKNNVETAPKPTYKGIETKDI